MADRPAQAQDKPFRLVALGDSLTAGYELPARAAFPNVLERALKAQGLTVSVENAGVSGDTTTGGKDRLDWSVPDGTDLVIVELGANDMLRGIDPAITEAALDDILQRLKQRGIGVVLAGMLSVPNNGPDYVKTFNAIYPRLAQKHDVPLYPFFMDGVTGNAKLMLADQLHPSAAGVEELVTRILPVVMQAMKKLPRKP